MKEKVLLLGLLDTPAFYAACRLLEKKEQVMIFVPYRSAPARKLEERGATLIIGNLSSFEDLDTSLKRVNRVYYNHPLTPDLLENTRLFIRAAEANGTEFVINTKQWVAEHKDQESILTDQIRSAARLFEKSAFKTISLILEFSVKDVFMTLGFIYHLNLMLLPFGKGRTCFVSNEDLGAVIVALLMNPSPHVDQKLRPTGPKSLSSKDLAEAFSRVFGQKVRYINFPEWIYLRLAFFYAREMQITIFSLLQLQQHRRQFRANQLNIGEPTNVVKTITGKEPDDFETIIQNQMTNSKLQKRSFLNRFYAAKNLIEIQLTATPKIKEFKNFYK